MCVCVPAYSYTLHDRGYLFESSKDQIQQVAVGLLNLAANAVVISMQLAAVIINGTALRICKLYRDPHTQWVRQ